jgi:hypothetical protein
MIQRRTDGLDRGGLAVGGVDQKQAAAFEIFLQQAGRGAIEIRALLET